MTDAARQKGWSQATDWLEPSDRLAGAKRQIGWSQAGSCRVKNQQGFIKFLPLIFFPFQVMLDEATDKTASKKDLSKADYSCPSNFGFLPLNLFHQTLPSVKIYFRGQKWRKQKKEYEIALWCLQLNRKKRSVRRRMLSTNNEWRRCWTKVTGGNKQKEFFVSTLPRTIRSDDKSEAVV